MWEAARRQDQRRFKRFEDGSGDGSPVIDIGGFELSYLDLGSVPGRVAFLSYSTHSEPEIEIPVGTSSFVLTLHYSAVIDPRSFEAKLNGRDITHLFHPTTPDRYESVAIPLRPGANHLELKVKGAKGGHSGTQVDHLSFRVGSRRPLALRPELSGVSVVTCQRSASHGPPDRLENGFQKPQPGSIIRAPCPRPAGERASFGNGAVYSEITGDDTADSGTFTAQATHFTEERNSMGQEPDDKQPRRSAAIAALLGASVGAGIGWLTWQATGNIAVGIGIAGPTALLSNNLITNLLRKGKKDGNH